MLLLLAAHFLAGALSPVFVRVLGRRAFLFLALVPLTGFAWALSRTGQVLAGELPTETFAWVPTLGLEMALQLGTLQWVMALLVTGVGCLVLGYCARYFEDSEPGLGGFAGVLVAFAGAMLGLVLADDLLLLYVFWELTTVFSYLLIGFNPGRRASRNAAIQALLVTTAGGLAMLVGIVVLGAQTGTYRISEILADPPTGTAVTVAVLLLVVGALSKSALLPFHFWLPGAMAAPTPVSAYLHAAAMVKAGIYLVALLAPAFAMMAGWHSVLLGAGLATMLLGGWRALRQHDLKLLLAYGTVSQLGLLTVLVGLGTRSAAVAGVAMLVAHALFKAALFLTVGVIDKQTGTRDLRELSGVARTMPALTVGALLAAASMAALPPMAAFVAKESAFGALLDVTNGGDGSGLAQWAAWLVVAGVTVGSALTVGYTARFAWGAFATKPGVPATSAPTPRAGFVLAPVLLGVLSLGVGFLGHPETALLAPYGEQFPPGSHVPDLALWHGLGPALALSVIATAAGALLFMARERVARVTLTSRASAEHGYRWVLRQLDRAAIEVTGLTQRGSTAVYLNVILTAVVVLLGWAVLADPTGWADDLSGNIVRWDTPAQAVVGALVVAAAVLTARSRRRLRAVVLAGVTGYGTAMLFLLHGAPDLALTQILVETVSIVVFVLVLRRLPIYFTDRPLTRGRYWRMAIGALIASVVTAVMLISTEARTAEPVSVAYPAEAVSFGGGRNIVNVILVDIRAWDTMGEIAVLIAAATGVASLVFLDPRKAGIRRVRDVARKRPLLPADPTRRPEWLRAGRTVAPERRSVVFEAVTRFIFHTIIVFSLWLLFTGHNSPGGGFAAGLVTGLALVVRYLAGGRYELDEAAPIHAGALLGTGLFVATASGLAPLALGGAVLQSAVVDLQLPVLGDVHLATSLFFDVGVYLVVVGLMLGLLRSLGAGIDDHIAQERGGAPLQEVRG